MVLQSFFGDSSRSVRGFASDKRHVLGLADGEGL